MGQFSGLDSAPFLRVSTKIKLQVPTVVAGFTGRSLSAVLLFPLLPLVPKQHGPCISQVNDSYLNPGLSACSEGN